MSGARVYRSGLVVAMLVATALVLSGPSMAGEKLKIGAQMPDFELQDFNGKTHKLSNYKGKIVVLDFASQECPYSRKADPMISKLSADYKDQGVVVLAIDAHNGTEPEAIKAYATEKKLTFAVLKDPMNKYADAVNAKRTPEMFIVDKEGKLVYHGALDNQKKHDNPDYVNYIGKALDELLADKAVSQPTTPAYGCGIKRAAGGAEKKAKKRDADGEA